LVLNINRNLIVREAMSSPALTAKEDDSVASVAKLMKKYEIGAIIVEGNEGQPVGIITERDLVYRVLAADNISTKIRIGDVMSSPLMTIDPDTSLEDATSMMNHHNIRRLGVIYKGNIEGVISNKDIIRIIPTMIEIVRERSKIVSGDNSRLSLVGYCDRCEMYTSNLRNVDGEYLCEDCMVE